MPETGAALVAAFSEGGAVAGAAEAGGAALTAGEVAGGAAAVGAGEAGFGAGLAGLGADAELGAAGASFGAGAGAEAGITGGLTGFGGAGAAADLSLAGAGGGGAGAGGAGAGAGGGNFFQQLSNIFSPGSGGAGGLFGKAGQGLGLMQVLSSLYGFDQSKKLQKQSSAPSMTAAGLQAVQRSMAAQGYQGSGNMAAALERYGAQTNVPNIPGATAGITGQLSSLGLLTSGIPKLAGWGNDPAPATQP